VCNLWFSTSSSFPPIADPPISLYHYPPWRIPTHPETIPAAAVADYCLSGAGAEDLFIQVIFVTFSSIHRQQYQNNMPANYTDDPDDELVRRTIHGDVNAYGTLFDRYIEPIYQYLSFRIGDREIVEDLAEIIFIKTWETLIQNQVDIYNFKAWIYRVARNQITDHYRTRKVHVSMDDVPYLSDPTPSIESTIEGQEERRILLHAVSKIEPQLQEILIYRFINQLSHGEIAKIMNRSESHLRVLQYRALSKLREILEKEREREKDE
jgi:RNA polymerase sigma-70 factor, ECF subfamily